jgi:hypothetical protein
VDAVELQSLADELLKARADIMRNPMSVNPTVPKRWRVGFDIGGTFTDFVLFDRQDGRVHLHKRLTSPTTRRARRCSGWRS